MSLLSRIRGLLRIEKLERELDEELRSHVAIRAQDNVAAGMSPEEARFAAQRQCGIDFRVGARATNGAAESSVELARGQPRVGFEQTSDENFADAGGFGDRAVAGAADRSGAAAAQLLAFD